MENQRKSGKKSNKKIWKILLIVSIIVILACVGYLVFIFTGDRMSDDEKNQYKSTQTPAVGTSQTQQNTDSKIDFAKLKSINSDIIGWLTVDGTDIDYPVLRPETKSDAYYLDHTYKCEYSSAGAIYAEKKNSPEFLDPVTVLYGHNWTSNGYFRPLYKFKDADFFEKNKYMYITTPEKKLKYEIYAAYEYDDRHILNNFDFTQKSVLEDYLQTTLNPTSLVKNVRKGVTLNADSKILTLSTCMAGKENSRYLVQGVLVEDTQKLS